MENKNSQYKPSHTDFVNAIREVLGLCPLPGSKQGQANSYQSYYADLADSGINSYYPSRKSCK